MRRSKPSSSALSGSRSGWFRGIGEALRKAYRLAVRDPETPPVITGVPTRAPSCSFDEAQSRVRRAAQSLDLVAALTLNPLDPTALDKGIELALRRLEEDLPK